MIFGLSRDGVRRLRNSVRAHERRPRPTEAASPGGPQPVMRVKARSPVGGIPAAATVWKPGSATCFLCVWDDGSGQWYPTTTTIVVYNPSTDAAVAPLVPITATYVCGIYEVDVEPCGSVGASTPPTSPTPPPSSTIGTGTGTGTGPSVPTGGSGRGTINTFGTGTGAATTAGNVTGILSTGGPPPP